MSLDMVEPLLDLQVQEEVGCKHMGIGFYSTEELDDSGVDMKKGQYLQ